MSEHIVENNPKKELLLTLGGVALFLGIVLLIGISGFLRPAGEHITAETMPAVEAEAPATATEEAATATAPAADNTAVATATPADATVTPATDADSAVVSAEAGTATAEGTVSQAAVSAATPSAEPADGVAAETTEKAPAAQ